jgi:hypothetical protein
MVFENLTKLKKKYLHVPFSHFLLSLILLSSSLSSMVFQSLYSLSHTLQDGCHAGGGG